MPASARTVEGKPFALRHRLDDHDTVAGEAGRHFVSLLNNSHDPPFLKGHPLPPRNARHAGHVCSRKGRVTPRPSLPDVGSQ